MGPNATTILSTTAAQNLNSNFTCNNTDGCEYICTGTASCYGASITCEAFGCNIYCDGNLACGTMTVNSINAHIHCYERESCRGMMVNFLSMGNDTNNTITCYEQDACNYLQISADNPFMKLNMLEYSANIIINNSYGYSAEHETITCDLDSKYIKYEFGVSNISELVKQEYQSNLLPCQDIHVRSGQMECVMRYEWANQAALDNLGRNQSIFGNASCIYLSLRDAVNIFCEYTKTTSPTTNPPTNSPTAGILILFWLYFSQMQIA